MKRFVYSIFAVVLLLLVPSVSLAQETKPVAPLQSPQGSAPEVGNVVQSEPAQDLPVQSAPAKLMIDPERSVIMPVPPSSGRLPFGQSHLYSVTLRGNGEAIVYLKTIFSNKENEPLSSLQYTFPSAPQNLAIYQVIREPQCIRYQPMTLELKERAVDDASLLRRENCLEYQEPDYQYGWGNSSYQKVEASTQGTTVTVTLPTPVKVGGTGSLVFAYTGQGITSKGFFGAYDFVFGTVKINDTIQNLQVGITTDPDYYLKDAQGTINYQPKEAMTMTSAAMPAMDRMAGNAQFDQFYNQIGYGTIVKNASNLQPNESFSVKGTYADNRAKLYGKEIVWGVVIVLVVLALAFVSLFVGVKKAYAKAEGGSKKFVMPVLLMSFGSSLFLVIYTAGLFIFGSYFSQLFMYYPSGYLFPMIMLMVGILSLCVYSLFLFVPGVVIGIKKNVLMGIITFVMTLFWLMLYTIILVLLFFLTSKGNQPPGPVYMPFSVSNRMEAAAAPAMDAPADVLIQK